MLPKETLSELLLYLAEHEEFSSLQALNSFNPAQVRAALKELAFELRRESEKERDLSKMAYKHLEELSPKVKQVLSTLTPREFQTLFKQFGVDNG